MSSQKMSNEQLVLRIKAGENVADNMLQLWQQNKKFVASIAKKYAAYEEGFDPAGIFWNVQCGKWV